MASFKPLNINKFYKPGVIATPDTKYWKRLESPTFVKEFGPIDYVDFSPEQPHNFAVTSSARVQIYNPLSKQVVHKLSRFRETAYGANFRQDGRLIVAGDEEGFVKLFETSSKNVLRHFKGHTGPVHRAFFTADLLHVTSFSDDKTVRLWNIATENLLHTFAEHQDYVRAGATNPTSANIFVSGGYDGKIKMYDSRMQTVAYTVDHESPVESLLFLPMGGIFISAGGTEIRIWDAIAGCRLLTKLSPHHKTITCLRLASKGKRILSAGLDRHVKVYDVASYRTVHTMDFANAILSVAIAPNDQTLVAGMVDGILSMQNMKAENQQAGAAAANKSKMANSRSRESMIIKSVDVGTTKKVDHVVKDKRRTTLTAYNVALKRFKYIECLQLGMLPHITNKTPEVTVSIMQELMHRKGLRRALTGHDKATLSRQINFICRHIGEQRFTRVLIDVAGQLVDVYEISLQDYTKDIGKEFQRLLDATLKEIQLTQELLELQGTLELLLSLTKISTKTDARPLFATDNNARLNLTNASLNEL